MSLSIVKDKVVYLDNVTSLDIPADRVLESALGILEDAVVIGKRPNGEYYFASSVADGGTVLWMMEKLKMELMSV